MKQIVTFVILFLLGNAVNAQNYLTLNITEIQNQQVFDFCLNDYDSIIFTKEAGCNNQVIWGVLDWYTQQPIQQSYDQLVLIPTTAMQLEIHYVQGCEIYYRDFYVVFHDFSANEPFAQDYVWKRTGDQITLTAYGGYNYQWSTGSTNNDITVTEPGSYWVRIYNDCGELYDTIQVRDNVEIELATCDLESNHNMVTWPTTPAQAEYVGQVEIKRDGMVINTVDYSAGTFIDEIGSDAASRTYTVTAIGTDGVPCPIESYPKETIHMAYLTGINNTIEVNWNTPTGYDLMGYNICEWNSGSDLRVIDFVGAGVTSYTCQASQFDHGNIVVQGVEATKPETRLLSNRSWETVGVGEVSANAFKVYPNPSNGTFSVEGVSNLTVYNTLGQAIATSQSENGKHTFSLASGVYFLKSDVGVARKVVVE